MIVELWNVSKLDVQVLVAVSIVLNVIKMLFLQLLPKILIVWFIHPYLIVILTYGPCIHFQIIPFPSLLPLTRHQSRSFMHFELKITKLAIYIIQ